MQPPVVVAGAWLTILTVMACASLFVISPWTYREIGTHSSIAVLMIVLYLGGNMSEAIASLWDALRLVRGKLKSETHPGRITARPYEYTSHTGATFALTVLIVILLVHVHFFGTW